MKALDLEDLALALLGANPTSDLQGPNFSMSILLGSILYGTNIHSRHKIFSVIHKQDVILILHNTSWSLPCYLGERELLTIIK